MHKRQGHSRSQKWPEDKHKSLSCIVCLGNSKDFYVVRAFMGGCTGEEVGDEPGTVESSFKRHLDQPSAYPVCSVWYGFCNVSCTTMEHNFNIYLFNYNLIN